MPLYLTQFTYPCRKGKFKWHNYAGDWNEELKCGRAATEQVDDATATLKFVQDTTRVITPENYRIRGNTAKDIYAERLVRPGKHGVVLAIRLTSGRLIIPKEDV